MAVSRMLNIATLAPIPTASMTMTTAAKPGALIIELPA
jgi:hypothetical protein